MTLALDAPIVGLGTALALGLLVGLEREWVQAKPLGVRTFGIVALFGGLCALLVDETGPIVIAAGLVTLGIILWTGVRREDLKGMTTLAAAPAVFLVGAASVAGYRLEAVVVAGALTLVLHWKESLHQLVERLGAHDLEIIARFVLISLVILPVLPDRAYGPYAAFNPFQTWFLVVLIVAINLAGYLAVRLLGPRTGTWLEGVLGGLISSTATTFRYAALSRARTSAGSAAALVVLIASVVVYARMVLEVVVVAPALVWSILWPALAFSGLMLAMIWAIRTRSPGDQRSPALESENPAGLKVALSFAALYVALRHGVAIADEHLGEQAIYAVAMLSGLMEIDALTLSVSRLHAAGEISNATAWRAMFLASLSNLAFKVGVASFLGAPAMRRRLLAAGAVALPAGFLVVIAWPA